MRYHLFQKFFGKMVKIKETSFLFTVVDSLTHTTVYEKCGFFINGQSLNVCYLAKVRMVIQFPNIDVIPLVERKDVSFISTIFPKNFWNK